MPILICAELAVTTCPLIDNPAATPGRSFLARSLRQTSTSVESREERRSATALAHCLRARDGEGLLTRVSAVQEAFARL